MLWERVMSAYNGAISGWRNAGGRPLPIELSAQQRRYVEAWEMYTGQLFESVVQSDPMRNDPRIYQGTRLLWKHAEAVVDFWAAVTYQGALSTDGEPLPNGAVNAIPIDPQTPGDERDKLLMVAFATLCSAWNWQQQMSFRPMYASALGDCLTELVDDADRAFVYPQTIWPGWVKEIELDYVGNIRRYVLEYTIAEKQADGTVKNFLYRKEVDQEAFRHFKDDKPYDKDGDGAVIPNPYGFVPAVWDRHRIGAPGHMRGRSAIGGTRQALLQLNSIFSHAFDFQRKAFFAPLMVASSAGYGESDGHDVDLSSPVSRSAADLAESFDVVPVPEDAQLLQATFDPGKTLEFLKDLRQGILAENPEASFYQQMREMQQVTAPGAERLMGDVKNRVDLARAGYDSQTVKLFQMAISMCGFRTRNGWQFDRDGRRKQLSTRQQAFSRFDLESFARGELDFVIQSRPIVYPTEQERLEIITMKEMLTTRWGMTQAGIEEKDREAILTERAERFSIGMSTGAFGADYGGE